MNAPEHLTSLSEDHPILVTVLGASLGGGGIAGAVAAAMSIPNASVTLLERTGEEVDRARVVVQARGLADRLTVHHVSARDLMPKPSASRAA